MSYALLRLCRVRCYGGACESGVTVPPFSIAVDSHCDDPRSVAVPMTQRSRKHATRVQLVGAIASMKARQQLIHDGIDPGLRPTPLAQIEAAFAVAVVRR